MHKRSMPIDITKALEDVLAAYKLHPEFLGLHIESVDQRGALDGTLLHVAARMGRLDHIQTLVACGANVNAIGDMGNTPLHDAALCGQAGAAELLLSLGAKTTIRNEFDQTPLDVAAAGGKQEVCNVLGKRLPKRR